jgi:Ca2+-binding RTX toxin-like protein
LNGAENSTLVLSAGNDKSQNYAKNSTVDGGAGDDTIKNFAANTSIFGGDGKDVIYGFENNDLLQITGTFSASYNSSKKEVAFKVGSGSITLKDFGTTTLFHVNSSTYQLSGSRLKKQ